MDPFNLNNHQKNDDFKGIEQESFGLEQDELLEDEDSPELPFDAEKIRIEQRMLSLKYVKELIDSNLLNLYPDFQRNKVWREAKRKSLLIESLMLRIPIPAFYFYEDENSVLHVIDGLQRLSTINDFLNNTFKLKGLQYLQESCNGKRFNEIDTKYVSRIYMTQLAVNVIDARTPSQMKFDLFRRINTGGVSLNAQEIRNSIAKPRIRAFLKRLANSDAFQLATGRGIDDTRMAAQELVLRFIAFYRAYNYETGELSYNNSDLELFLDRTFEELNGFNDNKLNDLEQTFYKAMIKSYDIFDKLAFRKYKLSELSESPRKKLINKSLFTAWSVILADPNFPFKPAKSLYSLDESNPVFEPTDAVCKLAELIEKNEDYSNALTLGTNAVPRVQMNFKYTKLLWEEIRFDFQ
ncbi:DUF262 domain-containing protein [Bacillus altitudinis]|uniref:DUF262 domain-containing protein n=1 Tax=Bacillus TaxID=1386 RepID=UPI0011E8F4E1|nr:MULTISPECIES: DUF262 domain-containing protein [Bacillus]MBR0600991.1 DUF262 domain-containing protein [Bacillus safensis]MCA1019259.1 DUF262 domain-containing protein [Bacillus stratosphericus]TYS29929.1 DUF262 domain-containing protein [Bacillus altitudinis]